MKMQTISLSQIEKSELNARRTTSRSGMDELKASIISHGLMQNLVVIEITKGKYQVIAGGRRLDALKELQKEGKLPKDYQAPCEIAAVEQAPEMSLAENTIREAMHPADEFAAFAALIAKGKKPAEIAERFGCTEKHVNQRLLLNKVHPKIIQAYRDKKITLEGVMGFTISDDQDRQLKIFQGLNSWELTAISLQQTVRNKMADKMAKIDSAMTKYVGIDAYKAAGGRIVEDLFGDATFLTDKKILADLCAKKINATVERLKKEGWEWVEVGKAASYFGAYNYNRIEAKTKEQKAKAGCYIYLNSYSGKMEIERGLVKKEEKKNEGNNTSPRSTYVPLTEATKLAGDFRQQIVTATLLQAPDMAIDYMMFVTALNHFGDVWQTSGIDITLNEVDCSSGSAEKTNTVAKKEIASARAGVELHLDWLKKKNEKAMFEEFRKLAAGEKQQLVAYAIAVSFETDGDDEKDNSADALLALIGVDVARYWPSMRPAYLKAMTMTELLKLGQDLFGKSWADLRKGIKAESLVETLEEAFADPASSAGKDKALEKKLRSWLPASLVFRAAENPKEKKKGSKKAA